MKETVIQFGEGNFLRGFFDWFLDGLNKNGLYEGKAVIVQPRAGGKVAPLNEQGCKYNLFFAKKTVKIYRVLVVKLFQIISISSEILYICIA